MFDFDPGVRISSLMKRQTTVMTSYLFWGKKIEKKNDLNLFLLFLINDDHILWQYHFLEGTTTGFLLLMES